MTVKLVLAEGKDSKGRSVIPSANALGVVKIESGEIAVVRMPSFASSVRPASNEFQKALTEAVAGEVALAVELEVSDLLGKRYGVMSGKFTAVASVPKQPELLNPPLHLTRPATAVLGVRSSPSGRDGELCLRQSLCKFSATHSAFLESR